MPQDSATHLRPNRAVKWDAKVPGLHLRTGARGSVWYLYFRTHAGKERRLKLGDSRVLPLEPARRRALEILGQVAKGEDPAEQTTPQDHSLEELRDAYMRFHAAKRQKASTREYTERIWRLHILPYLVTNQAEILTERREKLTTGGDLLTKPGKPLTVRQVSVTHCMAIHHALKDIPVMANRVMEVLHCAFGLAVRWKWLDANPVDVDAYPEKQRRRKPSPEEAIRLFSAMDAMREEAPHFIALVELLALTGCRRNEIMTARWEWVRDDGLYLPDSKNGERVVPLNTHAQEVLAALPREAGNPYIIIGRKTGCHLVSPKGLWKKLISSAKITALTMHDLRRYFAAAGIAAGLTLEQVGQLLGHTQAQTTRRYSWLLTGAATIASETVANQIKTHTMKSA